MTAVIGGDRLEVLFPDGTRGPLRLLGTTAPEAGACFSTEATAETRRLAAGKRVALSTGGGRWRSDRSGRLLAYAALPGGADLGGALVKGGFAQIDVWGATFSRFTSYVPAQQEAEAANRGLWGACAADVSVSLETVGLEGRRVTYVATVSNRGPLAAPRVSLDVRAPAGATLTAADSSSASCSTRTWVASCTFSGISAGAAATATVVLEAIAAGTLSTRASVTLEACIRPPCGRAPLHDSNLRNDETAALTSVGDAPTAPTQSDPTTPSTPVASACHPSYPRTCIPSPPPDLDCADIPYRDFYVKRDLPDPDPHVLDRNENGIGCEFDDY